MGVGRVVSMSLQWVWLPVFRNAQQWGWHPRWSEEKSGGGWSRCSYAQWVFCALFITAVYSPLFLAIQRIYCQALQAQDARERRGERGLDVDWFASNPRRDLDEAAN